MQNEPSLEKLAQTLARVLPAGTDPGSNQTLTEQELRAYVAGERSERVERMLASDAGARAQLQALAAVTPPAPPGKVRRKILGPAPTRRPWAVAAALVIAGVLGVWLVDRGPGEDAVPPLLAALDHQISVQGLARARGGDALPRAFADTTVRVNVVPELTSTTPLAFGLYAGQGDALIRLEPTATTIAGGAADLRFRPDQVPGLNVGALQIAVLISSNPSLPNQISASETAEPDPTRRRLNSRVTIVERQP